MLAYAPQLRCGGATLNFSGPRVGAFETGFLATAEVAPDRGRRAGEGADGHEPQAFCADCGSPLAFAYDTGVDLWVALGIARPPRRLANDPGRAWGASTHVQTGTRVPFHAIHGDPGRRIFKAHFTHRPTWHARKDPAHRWCRVRAGLRHGAVRRLHLGAVRQHSRWRGLADGADHQVEAALLGGEDALDADRTGASGVAAGEDGGGMGLPRGLGRWNWGFRPRRASISMLAGGAVGGVGPDRARGVGRGPARRRAGGAVVGGGAGDRGTLWLTNRARGSHSAARQSRRSPPDCARSAGTREVPRHRQHDAGAMPSSSAPGSARWRSGAARRLRRLCPVRGAAAGATAHHGHTWRVVSRPTKELAGMANDDPHDLMMLPIPDRPRANTAPAGQIYTRSGPLP